VNTIHKLKNQRSQCI